MMWVKYKLYSLKFTNLQYLNSLELSASFLLKKISIQISHYSYSFIISYYTALILQNLWALTVFTTFKQTAGTHLFTHAILCFAIFDVG